MKEFSPMSPFVEVSSNLDPATLIVSLMLVPLVLIVSRGLAFAAEVKPWGLIDNKLVNLYALKNRHGLILKVTNYGATITELHTPDRDGKLADIVLGYDHLDGYLAGSPYFGTIAGRCANRIAGGRFELGGKRYQLAVNNGPNSLHGGIKGFDKYVWDAEVEMTVKGPAIRLSRVSLNGEENFPGNLNVSVTYTLTDDNELIAEMSATTDASTLCNLAQHTYWNLAGQGSGTIKEHVVQIHADQYTPVDGTQIPTGALAGVEGTPFDFRTAKPIGQDLEATGGDPVGYDHNLVIKGEPFEMRPFARVHEPKSGRVLELSANQPGMQFYVGCFLDGSNVGKGGVAYQQYSGFCLETQVYPDAIHQPAWPQCRLNPGETYRHVMVTKFSAG
jgi:aldose 1-epimerase